MSGYTPLFSSIIASTIWRESKETKIVWITMLAMSDARGVVEASIPGLADMAKVSLEECKVALSVLMSPDEYSRTKDHDGRRIEEVDGGWLVLNIGKFRDKCRHRADYMREYRKRNQDVTNVTTRNHSLPPVTDSDSDSTHTKTVKEKITWLTPFNEVWKSHYVVDMPFAKVSPFFKKLLVAFKEEEICKGLDRYIKETKTQYASVAGFSEKAGYWINKQKSNEVIL